MIDALITSKTRIRLLTRLFLNSHTKAHLRGLATEFGESSNAIRLELNRFEKAGLILSSQNGVKKVFQANTHHPLYSDIRSILFKHIGFDQIILKVVEGLGDIARVYITGDYAKGFDNGEVEVIFVGNYVDKDYLENIVRKAEKLINRKIKYIIHTESEEHDYLAVNKGDVYLLLWQKDKSG